MLAALLAHDFPGVQALRGQSRTVLASRGCTCGCGTIDLHVPVPGMPAAVRSRVPVEAAVLAADGSPAGGVLLFVDEGVLSGLEVYSFGEAPLAMPAPDLVVDITADDGEDATPS